MSSPIHHGPSLVPKSKFSFLFIGVVIGWIVPKYYSSPLDQFLKPTSNSIAATKELRALEVAPGTFASESGLKLLGVTKQVTAFDIAADTLFVQALDYKKPERKVFDLATWKKKGKGGLLDNDRVLLSRIYYNSDSVFEFGLGESTYIAAHVRVPRYSGVDSDPLWVAMARNKSLSHFRFYFADIGENLNWGYPKKNLQKNELNYQALPLLSEPLPFDVYMVDGRWRVPLVALSFLHASARGADHAHTKVLLHDCGLDNETSTNAKFYSPSKNRDRPSNRHYEKLMEIVELVDHSGSKLCAFKRKKNTTNKAILTFWNATSHLKARRYI
jgi:hypothetical protein